MKVNRPEGPGKDRDRLRPQADGLGRVSGASRRDFLSAAALAAGAGALAACSGPAASPRTPAPSVTAAPAEESLPGDADWKITKLGAPEEIEGYADQVSVLPGQTFQLHVSTTTGGFWVEAFRVGWYRGARARKVWEHPRTAAGPQAPAKLVAPTNTVRAAWDPVLAVPTGGWPEGCYLLRMTADSGAQRYVPITVRSASTAGRVVLVNAVSTWQAYNTWGGYSLYQGANGSYADRSRAVTFDRPYESIGADKFMTYESAAVMLAERIGIPLAYTTSVDLATDPGLLAGARAVVSLGHDEYWTPQQRGYVTAARDAGVNVAFLGANAMFRRIRLEPTATGANRLVVCYKTDAKSDPLYGKDDANVTADFREPPAPDPESSLTGTLYESYPTAAPFVVVQPEHWLFAGTGVRQGSAFPGLVGTEYDRVNPAYPTPRPIEVVAHSPLICQGAHSVSNAAYYTVPGGAGVFNTGTMRWVGAINGDGGFGINDDTAKFVAGTTTNLLRVFAAGPAGHAYPAQDNLQQYHTGAGAPPGGDGQ